MILYCWNKLTLTLSAAGVVLYDLQRRRDGRVGIARRNHPSVEVRERTTHLSLQCRRRHLHGPTEQRQTHDRRSRRQVRGTQARHAPDRTHEDKGWRESCAESGGQSRCKSHHVAGARPLLIWVSFVHQSYHPERTDSRLFVDCIMCVRVWCSWSLLHRQQGKSRGDWVME